MTGPQDAPSSRLDSWKEIATYLRRDVRTVQRWEQKEGLPVHRQEHGSRASVYAEREELDAWQANRRLSPTEEQEVTPPRKRSRVWGFSGLALSAGLAAAAYLYIRYASPEPGVIQERQLLKREDVDLAGGPSWDGRFVPYRTTDAQMHLLEVATGKSRPVMKPPASGNYVTFAASPDGRQVAYDLEFPDAPAQLHMVSTGGSGDTLLFTNPKYRIANPRSWSPDGKQVAAMLWEFGGPARDLAVVDTKNKTLRVLYTSRNNPGNPQFSSDGRYIAFNEKGNILVIPVSGGTPTEAVSHPALDMVSGWAPDGRLVFTSDRSGQTDLYAVKLRGGRPEGPPDLIHQDLNVTVLGMTRTGSLIYSRSLPALELYKAELDPAGNLVSGPAPLGGTRFVGQNRNPDYTSDGQFLAYISGPDGSPDTAIRIRSLATGAERAVPMPLPKIDQLRWYPDGKAILLRGRDLANRYGFYRLDTESVHLTPVLTEGVPSHAAVNGMFSPDGKYLFYLSLKKPTLQVLMRLDLSTGKPREVYRPNGRFLRMFALSPDGSQVALHEQEEHSDHTARNFLFVKPLSGGKLTTLDDTTQTTLAWGALAWTADGKAVLYHRLDASAPQRNDLVRIPLNGGPPQTLVTTGTIWRIAANPDARRIIWQANGRVWEVSAIENLFTARR